jgi:chromosome segregation protein
MRIKRLDIMGFKSFPERVQIPFPEGISAVVGPNGCGKSNIVDAIRWVMGEQSPKQLRGRQMDDILFNGARAHQPSGMAEVTMVLASENVGGVRPSLGPSEISITRRLYRSGDSEYLINKVPCRLKDIIQFFMDTGMGTKAYAIIEQGRIGALVDARPEERRALIDEAAGITRYKAQKKEAERKIEATEQNLTHIGALMAETKRQFNSLARAARKAAQYKELKQELRHLDLALASIEFAALDRQGQELGGGREEFETQLTGLLTTLDRIEVELEQTRLDMVEQEKKAEAEVEAFHDLQGDFNKLKQEDEFVNKETANNEVRQRRLSEDLVRLDEQRREKISQIGRLGKEIEEVRAEAQEKDEALEVVRGSAAELKKDFQEATDEQQNLSRRLSEIRARHGRLEEVLASNDRMAEGLASRREELAVEMENLGQESTRLRTEFREQNRQKEEISQTIEEARMHASSHRQDLGHWRKEMERLGVEERRLDSVLAGMHSKLHTLQEIKANFGWYPEGVQALMNSLELREAGVIGPLAERISVAAGFENALEAAFGERLGFVLVKNRQAAAAALDFLEKGELGRCGFISLDDLGVCENGDLVRAMLGDYVLAESRSSGMDYAGQSVLNRDGDYFGRDGLIVGGRTSTADKGLLVRQREIKELESRTAELESEHDRLLALVDEAGKQAANINRAMDLAEEEIRVCERNRNEVERRLSVLNSRRGEVDSRLSSLNRALETQEAESQRLMAEKETAQTEIYGLEDEEFDLTSELEQVQESVRGLSSRLEEFREREQQARLEVNALKQRLATAERELASTTDWLKDIEHQAGSKEEELQNAKEELERLKKRRQVIALELQSFQQRLAEAQQKVDGQKRLVDEYRARGNAQENEVRQARKKREELNRQVQKLELDLQENNFKAKALCERIEAEYRLDLTALPEGDRIVVGPEFEVESARKTKEEIRAKIESMGEVNSTAAEEHEALTERYEFYRAQYDDLTSAIENLRQSISRINRTCKIRFQSTFEAVDQKLREIFPLLFEGGEAWLSLTDSTDPLESGVEIHVHPPGKKLTVMSLLSGGEKALVALALIFALYLIKPSPFCLLDETDAPLDEANIDRFNRLLTRLGQSSQIIMVTHNKRTMQISQTLYGVTMEEPGVSKMVSVNLSDIEDYQENAQMVQAG